MSNLEYLVRPSGPWPEGTIEARSFWAGVTGQHLLKNQRAVLGPRLESLRGQRALELSCVPIFPAAHVMNQVIHWAPSVSQASSLSTLVCSPSALPLEDEAMDLVVVHHLLEMTDEPHAVLREATRVTSDSGRLFLLGWCPSGVRWWKARLKGRQRAVMSPARGRSVQQLTDWLAFVDFRVEQVHYCNFSPSLRQRGRLETVGRRYNCPLGADTLIIEACRQSVPVRPIPVRDRMRTWLPSSLSGAGTRLARNDQRRIVRER
ncbi:methyltransferase domain-containing protein [Larsenimonas rhizosphaerae]|uniref:Methyltransferase domain-containing protein n=1 Tax=Larsenimonas rhizosphaerae TaxID=2944682 RepID=A0AA41ZEU9_9GAMM|nr:methyltransferase domain-containing protein [Larsenimonas rhizosphaerae]MCM2130823.1 class I SAM-dependent methyltransferase [Larsenimonas rhizosphaerae]MCX2523527.1 methyltransferase domain-containing protein [Larsenimonas rhizosphaerae]